MAEALGRGLSSLIPQAARKHERDNEPVHELDPAVIDANPFQPRTHFDEKQLGELAASIKEHGILQSLVVMPEKNGRYALIAGERRLTAAKQVGLSKVPVIIRDSNAQEQLELALIENIQRTDLGPLERAHAYQRLIDEFSLTQVQAAERVGKSREVVANTLRFLNLPANMQDALATEKISEGHAKVLLSIKDVAKQDKVFREMLKGMTVAESTQAAKGGATKKGTLKRNAAMGAYEEQLRNALGTKVEIVGDKTKGEIKVQYYSEEELRSLMDQLT
ncbi:MAG: ParB/RepB/Spo0J family partition protein [Patescibacteria group bacterium]|jgi:ParB family chromosome partitioning protein